MSVSPSSYSDAGLRYYEKIGSIKQNEKTAKEKAIHKKVKNTVSAFTVPVIAAGLIYFGVKRSFRVEAVVKELEKRNRLNQIIPPKISVPDLKIKETKKAAAKAKIEAENALKERAEAVKDVVQDAVKELAEKSSEKKMTAEKAEMTARSVLEDIIAN